MPELAGMEFSKRESDGSPRNTMRFDIKMAHIKLLIADGEVDISRLAIEIRKAIIGVVDKSTEWRHDQVTTYNESDLLHDEDIHYDFS